MAIHPRFAIESVINPDNCNVDLRQLRRAGNPEIQLDPPLSAHDEIWCCGERDQVIVLAQQLYQ